METVPRPKPARLHIPAQAKTIACVLLAWGVFLQGCATFSSSPMAPIPLPSPGEPRIVDTLTGEILTPTEVGKRLSNTDVIYVGELHSSRSHHRVQRDLLVALLRAGTPPAIGLEMVEARHQHVLDRWVAGDLTESALRSLLDWEEGWGHDFSLYRDIFELARVHKMPLFAINAPRSLVRRVAKVGREGLTEEELRVCPPLRSGNPNHRKYIRGFFHGHHSGHAHSFDRFYAAQLVWDEFMAARVGEILTKTKGPLVVLAGRGHIEFAHGIPSRVKAGFKTSFLVVLPIAPGHLSHYASHLRHLAYPDKRADFFWEAPAAKGPSPHEHPGKADEKRHPEHKHPHVN